MQEMSQINENDSLNVKILNLIYAKKQNKKKKKQ